MRSLSLSSALAVAIVYLGHAAQAEPARYQLDLTHTSVFFTVSHIGFADTLGRFGEIEGSFTYDIDTQTLSDVMVTIQSDSLITWDTHRDRHVLSGDFLDARAHPEIVFTAASGSPKNTSSGTVTGDLTLRGETRPVTLNVTLNKAGSYPFGPENFVLGLSMDTVISRSAWGMTYGVANGLVGDDVAITIETEAVRVP